MSNYEIKKEKSIDDFKRKCFLNFATDTYYPPSIFSSEFSGIDEEYFKFSKLIVTTKIDYSVSVGYYKAEKYKEKERVYSPSSRNGYKYETVEKERIVTDWKPQSSSKSITEEFYIIENKYYKVEEREDLTQLINAQKINCDNKLNNNNFSNPTNELVSSCILNHENKLVRNIERNFPGDTFKNFKKNIQYQDVKIDNYIVPVYHQNFMYDNKKYNISAYANKNMDLNINFDNNNAIVKEILNSSKVLSVLNIISLIFLIIQFLSPFIGIFLITLSNINFIQSFKSIIIMNVILFVINIGLYIAKKILLKNNITKVISNNQKEKIQEIKKYLIRNQLEMLSINEEKQIEIEKFDDIKKHTITKEIFADIMHNALFILSIILCTMFFLILLFIQINFSN